MSQTHLGGPVSSGRSGPVLFPPDRPRARAAPKTMMLAGVKTLVSVSRAEPKKCSSLVRLGLGQRRGRQKEILSPQEEEGEEGGWRVVGMQGAWQGRLEKGDHWEGTEVRVALQSQVKSLWPNGNRKERPQPPLLMAHH